MHLDSLQLLAPSGLCDRQIICMQKPWHRCAGYVSTCASLQIYDISRVMAHQKLSKVRHGLDMQWKCRHACVVPVGVHGWWLEFAPTPPLFVVRILHHWRMCGLFKRCACVKNTMVILVRVQVQELAGPAVRSPWAGMPSEAAAATAEQRATVESATASYVRDVAVALHHLHVVRRIVHRCAPPRRILVVPTDTAVPGQMCDARMTATLAQGRALCKRTAGV